MAVSIDTVYQRVLAMANKEQRGYITPQEFNLFANQAQMEIFEQYFYDAGQFNRMPKDNTPRSDVNHLLEEKISVFKKREQPVVITNRFGDGTLPSDVYRLDNIIRFGLYADNTNQIVDEVTEDEYVVYKRSLLSKPTIKRPVYIRTGEFAIKVHPYSASPGASAAVYFTSTGSLNHNGDLSLINITGANLEYIEVGQEIVGVNTNNIAAGTKVTSISNTVLTISPDALTGGSFTLTFASNDIKCNYIKKPTKANWGYTEINGSALYNSASSTDFELHASEETSLVYKILALSGIPLGGELYSIGSQEDMKQQQQEKQ